MILDIGKALFLHMKSITISKINLQVLFYTRFFLRHTYFFVLFHFFFSLFFGKVILQKNCPNHQTSSILSRVVQTIYCCAQSVKIHDTRTDSHLSYHKSSSRSKILKIQSCLRVPLPRSIFTTMAIKRSSLIEKFWLKNPTSNASNDLKGLLT